MFEQLTKLFMEEHNKLIDKCCINLLSKIGIAISEHPNEYELAKLSDQLRRKNIQLTIKDDRICLLKYDDLFERIIYGYKLNTNIEDNKVIFNAVPFGW